MGILLFLIVIAGFVVLLIRFRHSSMIFGLAIAVWIGALGWNEWILQTCSGDCNIRVDLVLIAPIVLLATGFAFVEAFRRLRGRP